MKDRFLIWLAQPCTNGDAVFIALVIALTIGLLCGSGAEHAAKSYARELFERWHR